MLCNHQELYFMRLGNFHQFKNDIESKSTRTNIYVHFSFLFFQVGRIYSTPIRLLVECEPDESLLEDFEDEGIELPSPPKCILYSLSHPMADLRAVIRKKGRLFTFFSKLF